jgi:hypothetical protein
MKPMYYRKQTIGCMTQLLTFLSIYPVLPSRYMLILDITVLALPKKLIPMIIPAKINHFLFYFANKDI